MLRINHKSSKLFYILKTVVFVLLLANFSCKNASKEEEEISVINID